jgi:hypothetical protein
MTDIIAIATTNLMSPVILCFVLGLGAALARSDLAVPEAAAKAMSIYLLFAIGFKGGASVAAHGFEARLAGTILAGVLLSFALPFIAFALLRVMTRLGRTDAAAVAAHYGSISIVTFVAATSVLEGRGIAAEGYMVAVAAAMEAPAILSALYIVSRGGRGAGGPAGADPGLMREILLNGSIVLLVGSFAIGLITGEQGLARISSFIVAPFQGVLCLFLLDMGLVAGRGLTGRRGLLTPGLVGFGVLMPLVGASLAAVAGLVLGLSAGGLALLMVLGASASYIAVPAAMRVALPEANPSIYLTLSLGVTFPFNLTLGIPVYVAVAERLGGA